MTKKQELMVFLHQHVFDPVLNSPTASRNLKSGINITIIRLNQLNAKGIRTYFWSAIIGTERSKNFARHMREEGFTRFEDVLEEFRNRFNDAWLRA